MSKPTFAVGTSAIRKSLGFHSVSIGAAGLILLVTSTPTNAQSSGGSSIGSVVQLPTFSSTSYSGSVLVPDRGSTSLGGVRRSASGLNSRRGFPGFPGGRAGGFNQSTLQLNASATIIDLDAMDRQLLSGSPQGRSTDYLRSPPSNGSPSPLAGSGINPVSDAPMQSATPTRASPEVRLWVGRARQHYRDGRYVESSDAYTVAYRQTHPALRPRLKSEYATKFGTAAASRLPE